MKLTKEPYHVTLPCPYLIISGTHLIFQHIYNKNNKLTKHKQQPSLNINSVSSAKSEVTNVLLLGILYDTIRYDLLYLECAQKLT